jgi:ABC-type transport system involved in multi-copper enzyme maturation permease subunit
MRWGLGPVFIYECLTNSRRWQTYAARSIGVAALLAAMATIALANDAVFEGKSAREYASLGESYFYALIGVELALVMLAAPAATASAICVDRSRGTLAHVLATDLSDPEIVLGKLAARLLPVLGLVACTWPVMAITSLLGGIDPAALTMAFAVIIVVALVGCTMALALSVWAHRPHEVVLATYSFWILVLLIWPIWLGLAAGGVVSSPSPWAAIANPFYVAFAPYAVPGRVDLGDYVGFFAVALAVSAVLTMLAVWRMRPVACRENGRKGKSALGRLGRLFRWLPGPSLDGNPVLWREWHRSRPSPWMTWLVALLGGGTSIACVVGAAAVWRHGVSLGAPQPAAMTGVYGYVLLVLIGLLMLAAVAPMSTSEERQRGSLDVLAATPLSTATIVLGKWLGTFRLVPLLLFGPGLMALALATARRGPPPSWAVQPPNQELALGYRVSGVISLLVTIVAHGAAITSVGLAMAIWIKRQSRAIAASVGVFVLVAVAWPILVNVVLRSDAARGLASLSPVWVAGELSDQLSFRFGHLGGFLWWMAFWEVGVVSLAIGLSWLAVRTFDRCFDRIPERVRTSPLPVDVLRLFVGSTVPACVFIALSNWFSSAVPQRLTPDIVRWVYVYMALIAAGLAILSAIAPICMRDEQQRRGLELVIAAPGSTLTSAIEKWWRVFRLVPLLAFGPGLIALGVATAPRVEPEPSALSAQAAFTARATNVGLTTPELNARIPGSSAGEMPLGTRLWSALLLVITILAHGAALSSLGLVLATWIKRRSVAIAISICTFVSLAVVLPALMLAISRESKMAPWMSTLSPIWPAGLILASVITRERENSDLLWSTTYSSVLVSLFAIALLWLSSRVLARGLAGLPKKASSSDPGCTIRKPEVEPAFVGD